MDPRSVQLAQEGGLNPFAPEWGLVLWTLIAFVVVLYFLAKKVFPRLNETLADREQRIKSDLERAEETRLSAERTLEEYKERIAKAREESNRIMEESRQAAEQIRKDLTAGAEEDARGILRQAQDQLDRERERAVGELEGQLARWSADIASRILERELSPEAHSDLVESFIRGVQQAPVAQEASATGSRPIEEERGS